MRKKIKYIKGKLNIPLIIFLLLVGGLLLVANIKSAPVIKAKEKVSQTVNDVSKNLNEAANGTDEADS
jgi:uncharacterized integral membrane protein